MSGNVRAEEFVAFRDEVAALQQSVRGHAAFHTMEEWLRVEMRGDGRGHIGMRGFVRDPESTNQLNFNLDLDQTFLPDILAGLDAMVKSFPVVGSPQGRTGGR